MADVASQQPPPPPLQPAAPPPLTDQSSPTSADRKSGFMHTVKKAIFGGDKHAVHDPEFEDARSQFFKLAEQAMKAQHQLIEFNNHMTGLLQSAGYVANELSDLLEDPSAHPYLAFGRELRRTHVQLSSENGAVRLARSLADGSIKRLHEAVDLHRDLASRLEKRMQLKSEYEYYSKKVHALQSDNDEKTRTNKEIKPAEVERLTRNQTKLSNIRFEFMSFSAKLLQDIRLAWSNRWLIFGPVTAGFVAVERDFVTLYQNCMSQLPYVNDSAVDQYKMEQYTQERKEAEIASVTQTALGPSASSTPTNRMSRAGSMDEQPPHSITQAPTTAKPDLNPFSDSSSSSSYQPVPPPPAPAPATSYYTPASPPPPPPPPPAPTTSYAPSTSSSMYAPPPPPPPPPAPTTSYAPPTSSNMYAPPPPPPSSYAQQESTVPGSGSNYAAPGTSSSSMPGMRQEMQEGTPGEEVKPLEYMGSEGHSGVNAVASTNINTRVYNSAGPPSMSAASLPGVEQVGKQLSTNTSS